MRLEETIYFPFVTADSTGTPTAPSVGPAFVLRRNGSVLVGSTDVVISGSAGVYLAAFTAPAANGWANNDTFSIAITATVGVALTQPLAAGVVRAAWSTHSAADVATALPGPVEI